MATRRGAEFRFPARFDVPGAVVLAIALIVLLLAITKESTWGWASVPVASLLIAAGAMVGWWIRWERGRDEPMVDLQLNRRRPILLAHFGGVMVGCATFAQYIAVVTVVTLPSGDRLRARALGRCRWPRAAPGSDRRRARRDRRNETQRGAGCGPTVAPQRCSS